VVAQDAYGNVATSYSGTVHVTSFDAAAVIPGDAALVNGVATLNVELMTVGTQTITATDVANSAMTGTVSSDATPPVPAPFAVSDYPGTTAGLSNSFTVTVRDSIGQVAVGYAGTVFFASTDVQAGLPASYTFTSGDAGVHTFSATLRSAGAQSIAVRDAAGLVGSETGIAVSPAAFSGFRLTVPLGTDSKGHMLVTADDVIPMTVRVVDVFGNTVTGYTGTTTFGSTDSLATLPAVYAYTAADAGTHTVSFGLHTATANGVVWSVSVADASNAAMLATMTNFEVLNGQASTYGVTLHTQITAGSPFTSKVTVTDAWGNPVKNYFGTVHCSSSDALAGLPADYMFNGSDVGVHSFSVTLDTSGTQNLSVVGAGNSLVAGSVSGTVKSAAASAIVVSTPATATAGVAQAVTVTAVDQFGNVADSYGGTVVLSSSDAQAGLPASYKFATKDNGVHTFDVSLKTAGTRSVTVQDAANAFTATQSGISVAASSVAGSFVVTGFPATTAGVAQSFTVTAKDAFGNMCTGYTGTVVFASSDAQAGLPASYTFNAADAGTHAFSATLKTAGTQSMTVKDAASANVLGSQSGISVNAAATIASISISGFSPTRAGAVQTFTVKARDAYGNVCTGYTGTVTFSSSDVQAGLPASYTFTAADAGSHTFSAVLETAGSQSITVSDTAAGMVASQTGISVTAGAAARFAVSAPTSVTQGVGFKFTVAVLDAHGNVATNYLGKVHLSSTDAKGGTSDYTFSKNDNGVHTFSYTSNTLGSQTLLLTDTVNGSVVGSIGVTVVPKL
jgi:hypothetical protein